MGEKYLAPEKLRIIALYILVLQVFSHVLMFLWNGHDAMLPVDACHVQQSAGSGMILGIARFRQEFAKCPTLYPASSLFSPRPPAPCNPSGQGT
jgi:hypothetical protein